MTIWSGRFGKANLKRKDSRLRDWNIKHYGHIDKQKNALKRKDSRLRDWNAFIVDVSFLSGGLEKKRFSITRLKLNYKEAERILIAAWKEKILDYEIETGMPCSLMNSTCSSWKEKILDYEIETVVICPQTHRRAGLEKKRFSITRLKQKCWYLKRLRTSDLKRKDSRLRDWNMRSASLSRRPMCLKRKDSRLRDWNQWHQQMSHPKTERLKKKRFSITRLKPSQSVSSIFVLCCLKRKDSRLRDWNISGEWPLTHTDGYVTLKRKDSRLRDWNLQKIRVQWYLWDSWKEKILDYEIETIKNLFVDTTPYDLEKKRFSITRLKRPIGNRGTDWIFPWKEKILDYEIETSQGRLSLAVLLLSWKEKILDYEIETQTVNPLQL